jgi:TIR domain
VTGRNLFEIDRRVSFAREQPRANPSLAVFISHSRLDHDKACSLADYFTQCRVDYYLDENDEDLQDAQTQRDHESVVSCIKRGLERCTHLVGILTENTKNSWWVPYEIGIASGRNQPCAHLIDSEISDLPAYIQIAELIVDRRGLRNWLPKEADSRRRLLTELERTLASTEPIPAFLPDTRSMDDIIFS